MFKNDFVINTIKQIKDTSCRRVTYIFHIFQALEYAKNVPRPPVKARPNQYNSYEVSAQMSPGNSGKPRQSPAKNSPTPTQTIDVIDIRTLEQRHLQERKNTDKIRQNMESVLSQKAH